MRVVRTRQRKIDVQRKSPQLGRAGFEIHGLILALHYEARFLKHPGSIQKATQGFDNILARYGATDLAPATPVSSKTPIRTKE